MFFGHEELLFVFLMTWLYINNHLTISFGNRNDVLAKVWYVLGTRHLTEQSHHVGF